MCCPCRKKEDKKSKALESVAAHGKKLKKSEEDIGKARTALDDHVSAGFHLPIQLHWMSHLI